MVAAIEHDLLRWLLAAFFAIGAIWCIWSFVSVRRLQTRLDCQLRALRSMAVASARRDIRRINAQVDETVARIEETLADPEWPREEGADNA